MTVVIDARHGSRQQILKDLKSSGLFEVVTEAKSLDDGIRILSNHEVDACLLGPSVTPARAGDFIQRSGQSIYSPDCAFVAILPEDSTHEAELTASGAHGVVTWPCSKRRFTELMVRAVVAANSASPWAHILLDAEERGVDIFTSSESMGLGDTERRDREILVQLTIERLIERPSLEVSSAVETIKSGTFGFDAKGKPSAASVQAVCDLANIALRGNLANPQVVGFAPHINRVLLEWVMDLRRLPDREATEKLQRRIASFAKAKKSVGTQ